MSDFVFAEECALDQGPTRRFYEEFLKGYTHKLNNLIGAVQGFSELLIYDDAVVALGEDVQSSLQQIFAAAKHMVQLNAQTLSTGAQSRSEPTSLRLDDALAYWHDKSKEICDAVGVAFTLEARPDLPELHTDAARLMEIYTHLLNNAAESAADFQGGAVAVDIFPPGATSASGCVDLYIRNPSVEMALDRLQTCFKPFVTTKSSEHAGLGLSAAGVMANDMGIKLGLRWKDGIMLTWLAIPVA